MLSLFNSKYMDFTLKVAFISYFLCTLLVCVSGNVDTQSLQITRGKHDTFTNLKYSNARNLNGKNGSLNYCEEYEAKCVDYECCRCRCYQHGAGTFILSGLRSGKCTKDEDIIPQSAPMKSFWLLNKAQRRCLWVLKDEMDTIVEKSCSKSSSLNMRWIWIKDSKEKIFRLMNVGTLQCLESRIRNCESTTGNVTMKQCSETVGQKVFENRSKYIQFKFCSNGRFFYLTLSKTSKNSSSYAAKIVRTHSHLEWNNARKHKLNWHSTTYKGCYRFQDEPLMLYLDNVSCRNATCSHKFFAPIFAGNKICKVEWNKSKILYNGTSWHDIQERDIKRELANIETTTSTIKVLKINRKALEIFSGSLLRLAISCSNGIKSKGETHCLLLKFKSARKPEVISTPSPTSGKQNNGIETSSKQPNQSKSSTSSTTGNPQVKQKAKSQSSEKITVAITVTVPILLIVLALVFVYLVRYRRRNRTQGQQRNNNEFRSMNHSKNTYEDPDRIYNYPDGIYQTSEQEGSQSDTLINSNGLSYKDLLSYEPLRRDQSQDLKENHDYESLIPSS